MNCNEVKEEGHPAQDTNTSIRGASIGKPAAPVSVFVI